MQQPTGWTPQPNPPPRRRGGWGRGLAITILGILGLAVGFTIGSATAVYDLVSLGTGMVLAFAGMWVGLALGIWAGVKLTAQPRPIDPGQYPNQTFRRV